MIPFIGVKYDCKYRYKKNCNFKQATFINIPYWYRLDVQLREIADTENNTQAEALVTSAYYLTAVLARKVVVHCQSVIK